MADRCTAALAGPNGTVHCTLEPGHAGPHRSPLQAGVGPAEWTDPTQVPRWPDGVPVVPTLNVTGPTLSSGTVRRGLREAAAGLRPARTPRRFDREWLLTLLVAALVPALMVTAFLFGRHTADPVTVVPAPRVYLVPPTTASSAAP